MAPSPAMTRYPEGSAITFGNHMHRVGNYWERRAEAFLRKQGLALITRNFLTRLGEIDLVMHDASHLIFVEVRYRKPSRFASAAGSVAGRKQKRLINCANLFRQRNPDWSAYPCRFDVIAYDAGVPLSDAIWLRAAFEAEDF